MSLKPCQAMRSSSHRRDQLQISNHKGEVGVARLLAGGGDHGVRLPAMMRLMIEEVHD